MFLVDGVVVVKRKEAKDVGSASSTSSARAFCLPARLLRSLPHDRSTLQGLIVRAEVGNRQGQDRADVTD